jgi:NTE family protein
MMSPDLNKVDAVFEGGGVKGIGLVGAVAVTEEKGYAFENVAGTSAGAIVAALVAAGYTATELKDIMDELDYNWYKDKGALDKIPFLGPALSLTFEKGIYEGHFLENWIAGLLAAKDVTCFGDLVMPAYQDDPKYRYKLQVIAADITRGEMLVLPRDIGYYGIDPNALGVAQAVRMSMSIPFFFEPVTLQDAHGNKSYIVDGGVLSNFPVWLFDAEGDSPEWPTFGYKLVEPDEGAPNRIRGPITMLAALFSTMMEAHDAYYIRDSNFARTIPIRTLGVRTTEFDLSREKSEALYQSGRDAADKFFQHWDFGTYVAKYRQKEAPDRRARV